MSKEQQPQFHPAGFDGELRAVLDDLRAGRWRSMRDVLETCDSWALRTSRSQVLAAVAADGDAIEAWLQEQPQNCNAKMMHARVSVQRALNAHHAGQPGGASRADGARAACWEAARRWPADPVPWVALLALAKMDTPDLWRRRPEHQAPAWEYLLPRGPWGLLREAQQRDPNNREAWHRMLQALGAYRENAFDFVRWVVTWAPQGSPLVLLPLYLHSEHYGELRTQGALTTSLYWTRDPISYYTHRALHWWFAHADPASWLPPDLNHLGQALHSGGFTEGREVFEAIGPFATPVPWKYVADKPQRWLEEFTRARRRYLRDVPSGPLHEGRHW
ncbi:hypothetical protein ACWD0J_10405 [Streptomyces sp. NPDC003011]